MTVAAPRRWSFSLRTLFWAIAIATLFVVTFIVPAFSRHGYSGQTAAMLLAAFVLVVGLAIRSWIQNHASL